MGRRRKSNIIGWRTGKAILAGKKIRQLESGFDNFSDYFTSDDESPKQPPLSAKLPPEESGQKGRANKANQSIQPMSPFKTPLTDISERSLAAGKPPKTRSSRGASGQHMSKRSLTVDKPAQNCSSGEASEQHRSLLKDNNDANLLPDAETISTKANGSIINKTNAERTDDSKDIVQRKSTENRGYDENINLELTDDRARSTNTNRSEKNTSVWTSNTEVGQTVGDEMSSCRKSAGVTTDKSIVADKQTEENVEIVKSPEHQELVASGKRVSNTTVEEEQSEAKSSKPSKNSDGEQSNGNLLRSVENIEEQSNTKSLKPLEDTNTEVKTKSLKSPGNSDEEMKGKSLNPPENIDQREENTNLSKPLVNSDEEQSNVKSSKSSDHIEKPKTPPVKSFIVHELQNSASICSEQTVGTQNKKEQTVQRDSSDEEKYSDYEFAIVKEPVRRMTFSTLSKTFAQKRSSVKNRESVYQGRNTSRSNHKMNKTTGTQTSKKRVTKTKAKPDNFAKSKKGVSSTTADVESDFDDESGEINNLDGTRKAAKKKPVTSGDVPPDVNKSNTVSSDEEKSNSVTNVSKVKKAILGAVPPVQNESCDEVVDDHEPSFNAADSRKSQKHPSAKASKTTKKRQSQKTVSKRKTEEAFNFSDDNVADNETSEIESASTAAKNTKTKPGAKNKKQKKKPDRAGMSTNNVKSAKSSTRTRKNPAVCRDVLEQETEEDHDSQTSVTACDQVDPEPQISPDKPSTSRTRKNRSVGDTNVNHVNTASDTNVSKVNTTGDTNGSKVNTASDTNFGKVNSARDTNVSKVNSASDTNVSKVNSASDTNVSKVNRAIFAVLSPVSDESSDELADEHGPSYNVADATRQPQKEISAGALKAEKGKQSQETISKGQTKDVFDFSHSDEDDNEAGGKIKSVAAKYTKRKAQKPKAKNKKEQSKTKPSTSNIETAKSSSRTHKKAAASSDEEQEVEQDHEPRTSVGSVRTHDQVEAETSPNKPSTSRSKKKPPAASKNPNKNAKNKPKMGAKSQKPKGKAKPKQKGRQKAVAVHTSPVRSPMGEDIPSPNLSPIKSVKPPSLGSSSETDLVLKKNDDLEKTPPVMAKKRLKRKAFNSIIQAHGTFREQASDLAEDDAEISSFHQEVVPTMIQTSPARRKSALRKPATTIGNKTGAQDGEASGGSEAKIPEDPLSTTEASLKVQHNVCGAGTSHKLANKRKSVTIKEPEIESNETQSDDPTLHRPKTKTVRRSLSADNVSGVTKPAPAATPHRVRCRRLALKDNRIIVPNTPVDGLRRSRRTRLKRLDYVAGERIKYVRTSTGFVISGIEAGGPNLLVENYRKLLCKPAKRKQPMEGKKSGKARIAEAAAGPADEASSETDEMEETDFVKSANHLEFVNLAGENAAEGDPLMMCRFFSKKSSGTGILKIAGHEEKPLSQTLHDTITFFVVEGTVEVNVKDRAAIVEKHGTFYVPPGAPYYIKNLNNSEASLYFHQSKT